MVKWTKFPKPYTKWFDYDKMKKGFEIRTRKAGDYIIVDDETPSGKKLKQVFTGDNRNTAESGAVAQPMNHCMPLSDTDPGCYAFVTPQTGKALKITFYGGKQNGFFKNMIFRFTPTEEQPVISVLQRLERKSQKIQGTASISHLHTQGLNILLPLSLQREIDCL